MNKRTLRGFSLGMFLTTSFLGYFYFFEYKSPVEEVTEAQAHELLKQLGYKVLTEEEYENLSPVVEEESLKEEPIEDQTMDEDTESSEVEIQYELEIASGMTTNEISSLLERHHMIKNAQEFEQYLNEHNYATKIQLGVFQLNNKMDFERIAKIITKSL